MLFEALFTGSFENAGRMRTPSLRCVSANVGFPPISADAVAIADVGFGHEDLFRLRRLNAACLFG